MRYHYQVTFSLLYNEVSSGICKEDNQKHGLGFEAKNMTPLTIGRILILYNSSVIFVRLLPFVLK
jgi:hypothetical protein